MLETLLSFRLILYWTTLEPGLGLPPRYTETMIQLTGAMMRFGEKVLFDELDWLVTPQDRIGVVGANGTGKSTLLKIIAGLEDLDAGRLTRQKNLRVGYLPQDGLTLSGRGIFDECLSVFEEALSLEVEQTELADKLGSLDPDSPEYTAVAERYQWVHDRYIALDGYTKEAQVGGVLTGLGFPKTDWNRRTEEFSGGWQMRIALAKLLLERPNVLLLDEPTNHLDLEARNWLEDYLAVYPFAYLIISHDRFFFDATVKKIIEIWNRKVHFYSGNYSQYEVAKQTRRDQLQASYNRQQDEIRCQEAFINRFRSKASKAKQVQSRVKALEKVERIEIPDEEATIHFRFPQPRASGRVVVRFEGVTKSYGANEVLRDVDLSIDKGSRIALIGVNGAGKSTLIRMLAGNEELTAGIRTLGHNVDIDYLAQDQYKVLNPEARLFDDLASVARASNNTEIRKILGCFLFSGDDVFKPIGVLSGGERNRYALARVLMQPSNFMLLDEPTNHLDLRAKEVLLRSLLDYTGTIVFVSHDRYFIDKLATHVYAVGNGKLDVYPGNYEEYLWHLEQHGGQAVIADPGGRSRRSAARAGKKNAPATAANGKVPAGDVSDALRSALAGAQPRPDPAPAEKRAKRLNPLLAKRLRRQVGQIEDEITELEATIAQQQLQLTEHARDHERLAAITTEMEQHRERVRLREKEWEELNVKLEG